MEVRIVLNSQKAVHLYLIKDQLFFLFHGSGGTVAEHFSAVQEVPRRELPSAEDLYYAHYRLWEITKFDDLIREQKDLQKSVTVDGVNQSAAQGYSFAKLWKVTSGISIHKYA